MGSRFHKIPPIDMSDWFLQEGDGKLVPDDWVLPMPWISSFVYTHCKAHFWGMHSAPEEDRPKVLQVGCAEGGDAVDIAKILKLPMIDGILHVVDWFKGNLTVEDDMWSYNIDNIDPWKSHLWSEAEKFKVVDRITVFEGDSREILPTLTDNYYDMVFIDGGHEHFIAKSDMKHGWKKLKSGGVMILDDLSGSYDDYLKYDLKNASSEIIDIDTHTFEDGRRFHVGVVKAAYEQFEPNSIIRIPCHDKAYIFKS